MPTAATFAQLANRAGYQRDDPLVIAAGSGRVTHLARGCLPAGAGRVTTASIVYLGSLAKQVTAACAALLVRAGKLDVETPLAGLLPELGDWSRTVRVRHLLHHTSGLPLGPEPADHPDRTTAGVLAAIRAPDVPPGTRYAYSSVGYVLLAEAVSRAAGEPLPEFARRHVLGPLAMDATLFWTGPGAAPPGAVALDPVHPAPLSLGDGGLWGTALDLLRWADGLNQDRLGVTDLIQAPGFLDDGTPLDYAWGMGVRAHTGHRVYRHGGGYADVRTMLVRVPERGLGLVILAPADRSERTAALTDALLDVLIV
jgi:CubicO group peptidase (beta-lactamase class C family)